MSRSRTLHPVFELGPMPQDQPVVALDARFVHAPVRVVFDIVRQVQKWPERLRHYRWVRVHRHTVDGGGVVEMAANRPFGALNWRAWWLSQMQVVDADGGPPLVRFRHILGITSRMEVEWRFEPKDGGTQVTLLHVWDGPRWPLIGRLAATALIGPVFVHGIASRTLAGLAVAAEIEAERTQHGRRVGQSV